MQNPVMFENDLNFLEFMQYERMHTNTTHSKPSPPNQPVSQTHTTCAFVQNVLLLKI